MYYSRSEPFARLGLLGGLIIGLPALMNYGSPALKAKVLPDILAGKKVSSQWINYTPTWNLTVSAIVYQLSDFRGLRW